MTGRQAASRKETKDLLKKGRIRVNDNIAVRCEMKIDPEKDKVYLDNKLLSYKRFVYIMLNKPKEVVSATKDSKHQTVLDLVPETMFRKGLFPAGRLDKDTTGFVLLTDDGDFAHKILSPKSHVPKVYRAVINGSVTSEHVEQFEKGMILENGEICKSALLSVIYDGVNPVTEITICEGKYHQIKRMFEAVGRKVLELQRTKIGGLDLDENLVLGTCRELAEQEIEKMLEHNP
jgi:16S rRNA pseudouridine516 synthase